MKTFTIGDFVVYGNEPGTWMIQNIVFNHELGVRQVRISKVGNPKDMLSVDPVELTLAPNWKT